MWAKIWSEISNAFVYYADFEYLSVVLSAVLCPIHYMLNVKSPT